MSITITFPDEVAAAVPDVEAAALLGVDAAEGYRLGNLSLGQVARLMHVTVWEAGELLASRGCRLEQSVEEIESDLRTLEEIMER